MPKSLTFFMKPVEELCLKYIQKASRILIPFAGEFRFASNNLFGKKEFIYIDNREDLPEPYLHGDCLSIMESISEKYDLILSDPPFSFFQAIHTYHQQCCRELYDSLLIGGGHVISLGFNSTGMSAQRGYLKKELLIINQGGSHNDLLILVEQKLTSLF